MGKFLRPDSLPPASLGKQGMINMIKGQVKEIQSQVSTLDAEKNRLLSQLSVKEVTELERRDSKRLAEECLRTYLGACDSALTQARGEVFAADGNTPQDAQERARKVWSLLQRARLFVIGPMQYAKMHYAADRFTTEDLAGLDWLGNYGEGPPVDPKIAANGQEKLIEVYQEIGPTVPFPQSLPFEAVFLAYGEHVKLSDIQFFSRVKDLFATKGIQDTWLLGHVLGFIGDQPYAASVLAFEGPDLNGRSIGLITTYENGEWFQPMSLDPWVVPGMIEIINEHKKLIVEHPVSLGMKMDHKSQSKKSRVQMPIPKPYYMVTLRDELIDQTIKRATVATRLVAWSHRWDVRGFESVRVMKGKLPLDPKLETKLKKKEYRIYRLDHIPQEDRERLNKRKVSPPARDEWLAIKSYWTDSYIKGSPTLPYVPAMRKMKNEGS